MSMVEIQVAGEKRQVSRGTTLLTLAKEYGDRKESDILLAIVDGKLQELHKKIEKPSSVRFLTIADPPGMRAYERSLQLLMNRAIIDVVPPERINKVVSKFSVAGGIYIEARGRFSVDEDWIAKVKRRMEELAAADYPIVKSSLHVDDAIAFFSKVKMYDKENLFRYRRSSFVNIYSIDGFSDYHYGYMVPSTGYLKVFDLQLYRRGFVLMRPDKKEPSQVTEFVPQEKLFNTRQECSNWSEKMNMDTVGDINNLIAGGHLEDLILISEARQEKQIADIAQQIASQPNKKFVMIAGPSSSGKTSFSHRLCVQLRVQGLTPHPVAVDNYFVEREKNPRDENGDYDFEALECVDIAQFNADMNALLAGETVQIPSFNFVQGRREYHGNYLKMGPNDILVIEGIHCLNDKLSCFMPAESKFKIYVSALTQLNIDEHNRIPSTDGRLVRRMIRDARTRGSSARETLARWASVRRGEEKNIFPYQESADVMFNSSLIYEFSVLKPYAEQLLFGIPQDAPEFQEAKRLLKFFDYFLAVDSCHIPSNSLLKEFIGGSIFRV